MKKEVEHCLYGSKKVTPVFNTYKLDSTRNEIASKNDQSRMLFLQHPVILVWLFYNFNLRSDGLIDRNQISR